MQTVRVLDRYRLAITDDPIAVSFMAQTKRSAKDVRSGIDRLYRANYLVKRDRNLWKATQFGIDIFERLGLVHGINEYLIASQTIEAESRIFLSSEVATKSSVTSPAMLGLLQTIEALRGDIEKVGQVPRDSLRRMLYAAVVGLDPELEQLGPERFCEARSASIFHFAGQESSAHLAIGYCYEAVSDVQQSNSWLTRRDTGELENAEFIRLFSFVRLIGAASSGVPDRSLIPLASSLNLQVLGDDRSHFASACEATAALWMDSASAMLSPADELLLILSEKIQNGPYASSSWLSHGFQNAIGLIDSRGEIDLSRLAGQIEILTEQLDGGEHAQSADLRTLKRLSVVAEKLRNSLDAVIDRFPP